jgi:hypothetical protein
MNTELPVRSAVLKHCTGGLVVRWVTTSESPLLYVFVFLLLVRSTSYASYPFFLLMKYSSITQKLCRQSRLAKYVARDGRSVGL